MRFLLITYYAPMGAMGEIAPGERRMAFSRPARSAVLGLVAAALGLRRDDPAHTNLERGVGYAVRTDSPGRPFTDYHTAQTPQQKRSQAFATRRDELAADTLNTVLSVREFVAPGGESLPAPLMRRLRRVIVGEWASRRISAHSIAEPALEIRLLRVIPPQPERRRDKAQHRRAGRPRERHPPFAGSDFAHRPHRRKIGEKEEPHRRSAHGEIDQPGERSLGAAYIQLVSGVGASAVGAFQRFAKLD